MSSGHATKNNRYATKDHTYPTATTPNGFADIVGMSTCDQFWGGLFSGVLIQPELVGQ